ncbi:MAG TPA: RNA pseudouridine synthase, partial [Thiothrix sp.]|nr:RNA pseudouridine synthase [Thiothrix sp.]
MTRFIYTAPPDEGLNILYCDNDLLLVDKPAGLLSVPGKGEDRQDCMIARVQREYPDALIVHRLDMMTSGIMLMARHKTSHRQLSDSFAKRAVKKQYIAWVDGQFLNQHSARGMVDLPLITDWINRPKQKIDFLRGKASQTRYEYLNYNETLAASRIKLMPITGRSHQLRVHLLALGHPILGDRLYANES